MNIFPRARSALMRHIEIKMRRVALLTAASLLVFLPVALAVYIFARHPTESIIMFSTFVVLFLAVSQAWEQRANGWLKVMVGGAKGVGMGVVIIAVLGAAAVASGLLGHEGGFSRVSLHGDIMRDIRN